MNEFNFEELDPVSQWAIIDAVKTRLEDCIAKGLTGDEILALVHQWTAQPEPLGKEIADKIKTMRTEVRQQVQGK